MTPLESLSSAGLFGELRAIVRKFREGHPAEAIERLWQIRREVARRRSL